MTQARWLRLLARPGSVLLPMPQAKETGLHGVFAGRDRRRRPLVRVAERQVEAARASGWIVVVDGEYRITPAGRQAGGSGTTQLSSPDLRRVDSLALDADGALMRVSVNPDEGAVAKWRGVLPAAACAAAEQFVADYLRSTLHQSVTRNWSPTAPRRGETQVRGPEDAAIAALAAKDRVFAALDALGPQFARIIEAALIREESLAAMERRFGWPRRSGRTGVELAFARLAQIYGYATD